MSRATAAMFKGVNRSFDCFGTGPLAKLALRELRQTVQPACESSVSSAEASGWPEVWPKSGPYRAIVGAVFAIDEAVSGVAAQAERSRAAVPDAYRAPVAGFGHIDRERRALDIAVAGPVGMVEQHVPRIEHLAHHRDMAVAHCSGRLEGEHRTRRRRVAAAVHTVGLAPPRPGIAVKRHARDLAGIGRALEVGGSRRGHCAKCEHCDEHGDDCANAIVCVCAKGLKPPLALLAHCHCGIVPVQGPHCVGADPMGLP